MPTTPSPPPGRDHWSRLRPQLEILLDLVAPARESVLRALSLTPSEAALMRELLEEADSDAADALSTPPVDVDSSLVSGPEPLVVREGKHDESEDV